MLSRKEGCCHIWKADQISVRNSQKQNLYSMFIAVDNQLYIVDVYLLAYYVSLGGSVAMGWEDS